jgi:hypothetical protein
MSFFRKLFGRETVAELEAKAQAEAAEGRFGIAKLDLERAIERSSREDETARLRILVSEMRDKLAEARLVDAQKFIDAGLDGDAIAEATGAVEVAATEELRDRARAMVLRLRTRTARTEDFVQRTMTRAELVAEIMAVWGDEQTEEYATYGESAIDASVALAVGEFAKAKALFEELFAGASAPRWLHRDLARARWAAADLDAADDAFVAFFEAITDEDHDRALFEARIDRARLFEDRERLDDALAEAGDALEHASHPRDYAVVARFLRDRKHPTEAREVLEAALTLPGSEADPVVQIELAFAESDEGRDGPALDRLDQVALALAALGQEAPRDVQAARARLLERTGRKDNAAELHRRLALAYLDDFGFEHALEASRLHRELGSFDEARELFARAELLVGTSAQRAGRVAAEKAALDAP